MHNILKYVSRYVYIKYVFFVIKNNYLTYNLNISIELLY